MPCTFHGNVYLKTVPIIEETWIEMKTCHLVLRNFKMLNTGFLLNINCLRKKIIDLRQIVRHFLRDFYLVLAETK